MAVVQQMKIKLVSNDGKTFEVDQDVAFKSQKIKEMYQRESYYGVPENFEVFVDEADGTTLKKVIEYCIEYRSEIYQQKDENEDQSIVLTEKDLAYLTVSDKFLVRMMTAANFLNIPGLMDIICAMINFIVKETTAKKTRKVFENDYDLTEEEKQKIWKNYEWFDM